MSTVTKTFKIDGVATNMTSVTLSDSTGTFGVKRNDTDAVVVADGTAMSNPSTGTYSYTFDDPAYDLTYTAAFEIVYSGETYWIEDTFTGPSQAAAGTASTLRLNLAAIIQRVSDYIGTGLSPSGDNLTRVLDIINDGYTNFLFPPPIPDRRGGFEPDPHVWSFLTPTATLSLAVDDWQYDMPEDFGGLYDMFTYPVNTASTPTVTMVPEGRIRDLRAANDMSSDPYYVAVRVKTNTTTDGPKWEAIFYPTPDTARTLTYRYTREYSKLDATLASGTAAITGTGTTFTTLTDASGNLSSVQAGDLVLLSECSGPTEGIYTVASVTSSTVLVLATTTSEAGTCSYRVIRGTVYPQCPVWCHQALIESMLDVAARRHDDETSGSHTQQYMTALGAAVRRDRLVFRERTGGYSRSPIADSGFIRLSIDRSYNSVAIT